MRLPLLALLTLVAAAPATKPTSRPVAAPKQRCTMMNGSVMFTVPADFKEAGRSDDEKQAVYESPDGQCRIQLIVSPQEMGFPTHNDRAIDKLKTVILNGIREQLKAQNCELLYGPRSETDDRFLLRIHVRYKHEGEVLDDVHTYRAAGIDIILVLTQVKGENNKDLKHWDAIGEDVCLSLQVGPAVKKKPNTTIHSK
jgi:hypothetical protein